MRVLWKPSPLPRQRIRAAHTAHSKGPYADAFLYDGAIQKPMGIQGVSSPHIPPPAQKIPQANRLWDFRCYGNTA